MKEEKTKKRNTVVAVTMTAEHRQKSLSHGRTRLETKRQECQRLKCVSTGREKQKNRRRRDR